MKYIHGSSDVYSNIVPTLPGTPRSPMSVKDQYYCIHVLSNGSLTSIGSMRSIDSEWLCDTLVSRLRDHPGSRIRIEHRESNLLERKSDGILCHAHPIIWSYEFSTIREVRSLKRSNFNIKTGKFYS